MCEQCIRLNALGLVAPATMEQIKEAYRTLVKVWHPDRFESDTRLKEKAGVKLGEINAAYEYLVLNFDLPQAPIHPGYGRTGAEATDAVRRPAPGPVSGARLRMLVFAGGAFCVCLVAILVAVRALSSNEAVKSAPLVATSVTRPVAAAPQAPLRPAAAAPEPHPHEISDGDATPATSCDRYAAADPARPDSGVSFARLDAAVAVPACEEAVKTYPESLRLAFELGRSYLKRGDYPAALEQFRPGAERGYAADMNAIGGMYSAGTGVPKDEAEAVSWYRKSAERGYAGAQLNLAAAYMRGVGVGQDYAASLEWYRKAAVQGSAEAQENVGYLYLSGLGVKQDNAEAAEWFRRAAVQGLGEAEYNLGMMYEHGMGVPMNHYQAITLYREAADQGVENAKKKLIALGVQ